MITSMVGRWLQELRVRKEAREHLELTQRQAVVEDCYLALRSLSTWDRRVLAAPDDAEAYGHRALTLTLLGRQREAQVDIDLAARLGLDRRCLREEARTLRRLSLDLTLVEDFGGSRRNRPFRNSLVTAIGLLLPR